MAKAWNLLLEWNISPKRPGGMPSLIGPFDLVPCEVRLSGPDQLLQIRPRHGDYEWKTLDAVWSEGE